MNNPMPNLPGDRSQVESPAFAKCRSTDDLLRTMVSICADHAAATLRQIEREKNLKRAQLAALGLGPKDPQAIDTSNWDRNYLIRYYDTPGRQSGD